MNKTIIINMNGIIFHIEEDAYEALKNYMAGVKRHFAYTADSDEIVTDIESRIAEMFTELLEAEKKQVVGLKDVETITAQMGSVSDFESADESPVFEDPYVRTGKKLYKDVDDRVIGGICSGIAHYFGIDPKWVRLIFILLLIFGGSGFLIYVILAIVMPKARTRAEKMQMKGEQVNIHNFKKSFDEENDSLRAGHALKQGQSFIEEVFSGIGKFIVGIAGIFIKVACGFIILSSFLALLSVFIMLFVLLGFVHRPDSDMLPFLAAINPEYRSALYFSAFVITAIPLLALILFAIRVLTNYKIITRTGTFAMLIIWLTGLGSGIYYGTQLASEFSDEASFSDVNDIKASPVYYLHLDDSKIVSHEDSIAYGLDKHANRKVNRGFRDDFEIPRIRLYIERSDDFKTPSITKKFTSRGPDFDSSLRYARHINYHVNQADSIITFGQVGSIGEGDLWRDQEVLITLKIPANTRLVIDNDLDYFIRNHNLWNCRPEGMSYSIPTEMVMTDEGLKCRIDSLNRQER